jgi:hypothetical protein
LEAVGGAFAEIRGGSFRSGFLAAGFSSAVAPLAPSGDAWRAAAFHAAAGGVGSVLGGGKFADGAVTGAFAYLFNDALDDVARARRQAAGDAARAIDRVDELIKALDDVNGDYRKLDEETRGDVVKILRLAGDYSDPRLTLTLFRETIVSVRDGLVSGKVEYRFEGNCPGTSPVACTDGSSFIDFTDQFFAASPSEQANTLFHEFTHISTPLLDPFVGDFTDTVYSLID